MHAHPRAMADGMDVTLNMAETLMTLVDGALDTVELTNAVETFANL